jgi:PAS domain S-box-containing protein
VKKNNQDKLLRSHIEDRKQVEREFQQIVDAVPQTIFVHAADGRRLYPNQVVLDFFGWKPEDFSNDEKLKQGFHPDDWAGFRDTRQRGLSSGLPFKIEARIRRRDGQYRWFLFLYKPLRDQQGRIVRWYSTGTEIEDLKRAEDALRQTQGELQREAERLKLLLELTNSMISKLELRDLLRAIAASVRRVMQCDAVTVRLPDSEGKKLRVYALDFPESKGFLREETFIPIEGTLSGRVFQTGKPFVSDDLGTDAVTSPGMAEGLKSGCFLPLIHRRRVLGVMGLGRRENTFTPEDVEFLSQVTGQVAIAIDNVLVIEERKRAEDALRKNEAYLAEAQRLSHTGSFGWNVVSGDVFWSEETFRIFEYDRALAKPSVELVRSRVHPQDLGLVQQIIDRVSHDREDFDLEHRLLMPDGSVKDVQIVAHAGREGSGDLEYVGSIMDVTERKRAEATLRERERELQQLIDVGPQYMCVYGADESPLYASDGLLDYFGFTLEDFRANDFRTRVFHPDDLERVQAVRQEAMSHGEGWEVECRILRKDGQYRWFLIRGKPLRDEQGRIVRWYSSGTDIESLKRAEEALQQTQAELAHVTRVTMLGELTASIAHEINQPLSAIVTNGSACLRWLAGDLPNLDEAREAARRVIRDGNRASEVIARIRALSRKTDIQKERLDLNEAIQEVVVLAQGQVRRNKVALKTELAGGLPPVLGDRVQLQQVLLNLMMNGIEAMNGIEDRSRELVIRTRSNEADQVRVTVQDSGIGIDPQSTERIFDAFYTTKPGGMGMGLSISRSIVENHGGRLWAVPNDDHGTTFEFTLLKYQ